MARQRVSVIEVHHKLELFDLEFFMPKLAYVEDQRFLSSRCSIAKKEKYLHCRETVKRRSLLFSLKVTMCVSAGPIVFYIQHTRREGVASGVNRL